MTNWIAMSALIAFTLYVCAWWRIIDLAIPSLRGGFWSFSIVAIMAFGVPIMVADLTFANRQLGDCLMWAWFALPFIISIVFACRLRTRFAQPAGIGQFRKKFRIE